MMIAIRRMAWIALAALYCTAAPTATSDITAEHYQAHVNYLASPEMKGRLTGSPELKNAAQYIADRFHEFGVQPIGGSYFQEFPVTAKTGLGPRDMLSIHAGSKVVSLKETIDFVPLNLSSNASTEAQVVFAGYGITAPEYHYDDYGAIDAKGKVVVILRHEPQEADERSVFDGKNYTVHAQLSSKLVNAKLHGAKAVLMVNDLPSHPGDEDQLDRFAPSSATEDIGIPADQITVRTADFLLRGVKKNVGDVIASIDRTLTPQSVDLGAGTRIEISVDIKEETRGVYNVAGFVAGASDEYVIIGAHYDHLGLGEQYSLAPSQTGRVHPGADDNASGTAGVIELARHFAGAGRSKRGFLFLCFAGEEEGLLGSNWYVNHPLKPLKDAVAMINMDMIGRLQDNKVYVGGIGTGSTFKPIVDEATSREHLEADESASGGYGASDHTSFTTKQVPTLFFFSGLHSDYHKPSDTPDKINSKDAVRVLDEIAVISTQLAAAPERPKFVRVQEMQHPGNVSTGGGSGYGPYFGSIPDFGGSTNGVRFADVRDGSPAAKAGFVAGDVLIEFGGKPIQNLYDFTYALREHKPGDEVKVKVLRSGKPLEAMVTLTKRN